MTKDALAHVLPNGIELLTNSSTKMLQDYALQKGDLYLRAFLAVHPDGWKEYLLVDGTKPIFASQSLEAVAVHIDMLALSRKIDET